MAVTSTGTRAVTAPGNASSPLLALDLNPSRRGLILQAAGTVNVLVYLVGTAAGSAPVAGAPGALILVAGAPALVLTPGPADQVYLGSATSAVAPAVIVEL